VKGKRSTWDKFRIFQDKENPVIQGHANPSLITNIESVLFFGLSNDQYEKERKE
jgi:hypothetical protein